MTTTQRARATGAGLAALTVLAASFAEGGETPDDAVGIGDLPFLDTGDTSNNVDDADATCPYAGSTSPDVFYAFTPDESGVFEIALCESGYDTKTYVLDASTLDVIGCNDDGCSDANGNPFRSILGVVLEAGQETLIAVDGWEGDFGTYEIRVNSAGHEPPCLDCPGGASPEGEPCADDGSIEVNDGCNAAGEPHFTDVACGDTVCGIAWALGGTRDTDWYRLDHAEAGSVTCSAATGFDAVLFFLGSNPTCDFVSVLGLTEIAPCTSGSLCVGVEAGESWWFIAKDDFDLLPCDPVPPLLNDYVVAWECGLACPPPPCPGLGDLDGDGLVGFSDLLILLANWGPCP